MGDEAPCDLALEIFRENYVNKLCQRMCDIQEESRGHIQTANDRMKQYLSIRAQEGGYRLHYSQRKKGFSLKLQPNWDRPSDEEDQRRCVSHSQGTYLKASNGAFHFCLAPYASNSDVDAQAVCS